MADNLMSFLMDNSVEDLVHVATMTISRANKTIDADFKIKPVTAEEWKRYQKQTNKIGAKGKIDFDSAKFNELLVINHVVDPDFSDAANIKKAGVRTPAEFLYKVLLIGEVARLAEQVSILSGFDADIVELKEEVKN